MRRCGICGLIGHNRRTCIKKIIKVGIDSYTIRIYTSDIIKQQIISRFVSYVKGKKFTKDSSIEHCGCEGHWLETLMGLSHNSDNLPDNNGFEQKKESAKITFGDWSASWYLFTKNRPTTSNIYMDRSNFIRIFGERNPKKHGRYSWSGRVFPKYGLTFNYAGQRLRFTDTHDLVIEYLYSSDTREKKINFEDGLKSDIPIVIAKWDMNKLDIHIHNKFGNRGFYICRKNNDGIYSTISFGRPLNFEFFRMNMENHNIFLDSGMYNGNSRNYSHFRARKSIWNDLITEEY